MFFIVIIFNKPYYNYTCLWLTIILVYYTIVYALSLVYYSYDIVGVGQWIIISVLYLIISVDIIYIVIYI
jgi:hypothetical protein